MAPSASAVGVTDEGHHHGADRGVCLLPVLFIKASSLSLGFLWKCQIRGDSVSYDGLAEQDLAKHAICSQSI